MWCYNNIDRDRDTVKLLIILANRPEIIVATTRTIKKTKSIFLGLVGGEQQQRLERGTRETCVDASCRGREI